MPLPDPDTLRDPRIALLVVAGSTVKGALVGAVLGKLALGAAGGLVAGAAIVVALRWWTRDAGLAAA